MAVTRIKEKSYKTRPYNRAAAKLRNKKQWLAYETQVDEDLGHLLSAMDKIPSLKNHKK